MGGILSESVLALDDVAKIMPGRGGKRLSFTTVWRWALKGVLAADGTRIKLESVRLGGRWITSREAIERFSAALTPTTQDERPTVATPAARKKASDRAKRQLATMGI